MSNLVPQKNDYPISIQPNLKLSDPAPINQIGPIVDFSEYIKQNDNTFIGSNPLLVSPLHGDRLPLDKPPYSSEVPLHKINDLKYNTNYKTYNDIKTGQIQYWYPNDNGQAYKNPVFTTEACVSRGVRITPMDVVYPEYNRLSSVPYTWSQCESHFCDSMTHDALEHRQELMEKQMRKRNQQEWKYYWRNKD